MIPVGIFVVKLQVYGGKQSELVLTCALVERVVTGPTQ